MAHPPAESAGRVGQPREESWLGKPELPRQFRATSVFSYHFQSSGLLRGDRDGFLLWAEIFPRLAVYADRFQGKIPGSPQAYPRDGAEMTRR